MTKDKEEMVFEGHNLYFNGINGATGEYLLPPMSSERLARLVQGKAEPGELQELFGEPQAFEQLTDEEKYQQEEAEVTNSWELKDKKLRQSQIGAFPVKDGVDPTKLDEAGWAVVFPQAQNEKQRRHIEEIKKALAPLFDLRQDQANNERFCIFEGERGYRRGERKDQFCKRQNPEIRRGPADPAQMPFYVLLIGSPEEIPFEFQFQLDVMRGVGRLDFGQEYEAYHHYAQSVVKAAKGEVRLPRRAAFFGVANPDDPATQLSAEWLVKPLYENLQVPKPKDELELEHLWQLEAFIGEGQATRTQLKQLLGCDGAQAPALLFTASHGVAFPSGHPQQITDQGALLCQDWKGPETEVTPAHYLTGRDLIGGGNVLGMMALFFACYGAGTPRFDHFAQQAFEAWTPIAPQGFIGALPQRLLGQGALAVIGHVERAWGYSFVSPGNHLDNLAFVGALRRLLNGHPVGLATDPSFDLRYADMSDELRMALEGLRRPRRNQTPVSNHELAHMWTATNDARNYLVLGDPAATLPVEDIGPEEIERPAIEATYRPAKGTATSAEADYEPGAAAEEEPQIGPTPTEEAIVTGRQTGQQAFTVSGTLTLQPAGAPDYAIPGALDFAEGRGIRLPTWLGGREETEAEVKQAKETKESLLDAIKSMAHNAAVAAAKVAEDAVTLEVMTYTSDDLSKVKKDDLDNTANLRALTRIKVDGDIDVCVPQKKSGEVDMGLWTVHSDMVQQAQENRAALIKTVVDAMSWLVKV